MCMWLACTTYVLRNLTVHLIYWMSRSAEETEIIWCAVESSRKRIHAYEYVCAKEEVEPQKNKMRIEYCVRIPSHHHSAYIICRISTHPSPLRFIIFMAPNNSHTHTLTIIIIVNLSTDTYSICLRTLRSSIECNTDWFVFVSGLSIQYNSAYIYRPCYINVKCYCIKHSWRSVHFYAFRIVAWADVSILYPVSIEWMKVHERCWSMNARHTNDSYNLVPNFLDLFV